MPASLLGHRVHPMLIVFPLGLLGMGVIFDVIRFATGNAVLSTASYYMIGAGIIMGLVAAVFGLVDWMAVPANTRAKSVGGRHGGGNVVVVLLFAVSWWLRRGDPADPSVAVLVLELIGLGLALVTGWLGGELVERLGVGVDEGAGVNAPSSLSGEAARR
jgi:uncharacterized membrane protein